MALQVTPEDVKDFKKLLAEEKARANAALPLDSAKEEKKKMPKQWKHLLT